MNLDKQIPNLDGLKHHSSTIEV